MLAQIPNKKKNRMRILYKTTYCCKFGAVRESVSTTVMSHSSPPGYTFSQVEYVSKYATKIQKTAYISTYLVVDVL